jgi:FMN-binding domain
MWGSATSSRTAALLVALAVAGAVRPAAAKVFLSVDEALALAFPEARVERTTVYLTDEQVHRAAALAGAEIPGALVNPYRAWRDGKLVGTAYFDTHRVRTQPETLMVVVDPEGRVRRVEVLSFDEPEDYLPRAAWYSQLVGHRLDPGLAVERDIRGVAGATLTGRATVAAVRRVLALEQVIPRPEAPAS